MLITYEKNGLVTSQYCLLGGCDGPSFCNIGLAVAPWSIGFTAPPVQRGMVFVNPVIQAAVWLRDALACGAIAVPPERPKAAGGGPQAIPG